MPSHFIESFKIIKLWGYRDINLTFNKDVNVLIGPNGSGKTTVLNLLHSILSADLRGLLNVKFEQTEIKLREFKGKSKCSVKVEVTDRSLKLNVEEREFETDIINTPFGRRFPDDYTSSGSGKGNTVWERTPRPFEKERKFSREFHDELTTLVPTVWFPVSRRLPITEDEEERYRRTGSVEPGDARLQVLLEGLSHYHSRLNTQLSERYREFEHQVLSAILYNKDQDQLHLILSSIPSSLPTEVEKEQLMEAFRAAGLLNKKMQNRINDHFNEAKEVVKRLNSENPNDSKSSDLFVLPLIYRTQAMVKYAGKLQEDRERIFAPLHLYEKTVNSFFSDKSIKIDESGQLKIKSSSPSALNPRLLSSGEKQILILLTQALLRVDEPVVYIADEPELSLHVTWQEKLLESIVTLGGQKQIIVATHSPDIVGKFQDNVIDLGRQS